jgi:hypothetical protein
MKSPAALRPRAPMAVLGLVLAAATGLGLSLERPARPAAAVSDPVPPAHSRTGPVPPRGVDIVGRRFSRSAALDGEVIPGVPAYLWWRGSGPTAVAMVLAYYDTHGFPNLLPGNGAVQSDAINLAIASTGHYADYSLPLDYPPNLLKDKSEPPAGDEHASDSLADFLKTSWSVNESYYGWTWSIDVQPGFESYVKLVSSYDALANCHYFRNLMFPALRNEVESRRPFVLLVDSDGDGEADHFVTAVGVVTESGTDYFGCYNTWDKAVHWYPYRPLAAGTAWGVHSAYFFNVAYGLFPPLSFGVERLTNDFIFFKENINRLTWAPNPANKAEVVRYRITRKVKGTPNTTYQTLAEVSAATLRYDDRNLKAEDLFIYRITSIDRDGRESSPSAAGN